MDKNSALGENLKLKIKTTKRKQPFTFEEFKAIY